MARLLLFLLFSMASFYLQAQNKIPSSLPDDGWLREWLPRQMGAPFADIFSKPDDFHVQIIYTQIERNSNQAAQFSTKAFGVNGQYHYPASTVKLAAAVLALEKINRLKIKGLTRHSPMRIAPLRMDEEGVDGDTTNTLTGKATVAHYIRKILLVSDNDAFNRLYEFIGQEAFNKRLHQLGFTEAQIVHRLSLPLSEEENRGTNAIVFFNDNGDVIYEQAAQYSTMDYADRKDKVGKGFMTSSDNFKGPKLVPEPMDFSKKNRWPLYYHHLLVQWIMFPQSQPKGNALQLTEEDYAFLRKYMSMLPGESDNPLYDAKEAWPTYVKFLLYGSEKNVSPPANIRIFNKVGDAYGFLIDGAYIMDKKTGTELLLSAVVYCNKDGILNDDSYDYDTLGFPFLKKLGEVILAHEEKRSKKIAADLSGFNFTYE